MTDTEVEEIARHLDALRLTGKFWLTWQQDVPALVAALREARATLKSVEWGGEQDIAPEEPRPACPSCHGLQPYEGLAAQVERFNRFYTPKLHVGHLDCRLARAIGRD